MTIIAHFKAALDLVGRTFRESSPQAAFDTVTQRRTLHEASLQGRGTHDTSGPEASRRGTHDAFGHEASQRGTHDTSGHEASQRGSHDAFGQAAIHDTSASRRGGSQRPALAGVRGRALRVGLSLAAVGLLAFAVFAVNLGQKTPSASAQATHNICERTIQVRDVIIAELGTDSDTSATYGTAATAHTAGGDSCATIFETVTATHLAALSWPTGSLSGRFRMGNVGLSELKVGDFAGLTGLASLHIDNAYSDSNPTGSPNENTITEFPEGIFQGLTSLTELTIENVAGFKLKNWWWGADSNIPPMPNTGPNSFSLTAKNLVLGGHEIPHNFFDQFGTIRWLNLGQNPLSRINTRWFQNVEGPSASTRFQLNLRDAMGHGWYYRDGPLGTAETFTGDFGRTRNTTAAAALATAMRARAADSTNWRGDTGSAIDHTLFVGNADNSFWPGFNLCAPDERPGMISSEFVQRLREVNPTRFGTSGNYSYYKSREFGCGPGQSAAVASNTVTDDMDELVWNRASWQGRPSGVPANVAEHQFRAMGGDLTELKPLYFKGIDDGRLKNLNLTGNRISEIADGTFADLGIERLYLANNALGANPTANSVKLGDWFDDGDASTSNDCSSLLEVFLERNGLTHRDIAFDVFDCSWGSTPLSRLTMDGNPLGLINTRWFAPLYQLRWGFNLDQVPITGYYFAENNTAPAANAITAYWDPYGDDKKRGGAGPNNNNRLFSTAPELTDVHVGLMVYYAQDVHWAHGMPAWTAAETTALAARVTAGTANAGWNSAWRDIEYAMRIFRDLGFSDYPARNTGESDEDWADRLEDWGREFYWVSPPKRETVGDSATTYPFTGTGSTVETTGLLEEVRYQMSKWATERSETAVQRGRNNDAFRNRPNYFKPPVLGMSICDRPKPIWADMMRNFSYISDELGANAAQGDWTGTGLHARWAHMTDADCVVMPVRVLLKEDESVIDLTADDAPAAFDTNLHVMALYHSGRPTFSLELQNTIGVVGSDGSLNPAHFANMQYMDRIDLTDMDIKSIPTTTFNDLWSLETLTLSGNMLDNVDLGSGFLMPLRSLKNLIVENNLLTEFRASWLTEDQRAQLEILRYRWNPIRTTDLTDLDLKEVRTSGTQLTTFDPAIFDMDNLETIWWGGDAMPLSGIHGSGMTGWTADIGDSVRESNPASSLGNHSHFEDPAIDADAVGAHWDHFMWQKARNDADTGKDLVRFVKLNDPCRPSVSSVANSTGDYTNWADEAQYGPLCLTEAQKSTFVNSIDSFNALYWPVIFNGGLSPAQMGAFLDGIEGKNIYRLDIHSNPGAFGDGFDASKLDAFDNDALARLWHIGITNSGLTYDHANTILRNLASGAYADSQLFDAENNLIRRSNGLVSVDFSYNTGMFTGVTPDQLSNFMDGVTNVGTWRQNPTLNFAGTDLNFDQFKAIIDSMDTHTTDQLRNAWRIRGLNLSDNPNIFNRYNETTEEWEYVGADLNNLFARFRGLTALWIGNTGLTHQAFTDVVFSLDRSMPSVGAGIDSAWERLTTLSLRDNDLTPVLALDNRFGRSDPTKPTRRAVLASLDLQRTQVTLATLDLIADGLETADALKSLTSLNLGGNPGVFDDADPEDANDDTVTLFKRFVNLRSLGLSGSIGEFSELQAITKGLEAADGAEDDMTPLLRSLDIANNPKVFTVKTPVDDPDTPDAPDVETRPENEDIVEVFKRLPNALKRMTNTDITPRILQAVLEAETEGQTEQRQREIEAGFGAQNPAFGFQTPLPEDFAVQSGRGSLRVKFTHNPMREDEAFTVLRYEYRYRLRPADAMEPWGTSDSEQWRTASLDLSETGAKTFDIYGLEPETIYQVQLRASSLALPSVLTGSGGTWTSLPEINEIKPSITEVSVRAGDTIRLEVNVYGLADVLDNKLPDVDGSKLIFTWTEDPTGGQFEAPGDTRRVMYTAPSLPGTYTVMSEAQPDGICTDHHNTTFDISDEDRMKCQATFTVRVSRVPTDIGPPPDPVNPAGLIPSSLTDNAGVAYAVFTPVDGGTFSGDGITVSAEPGAIPDQQLLGVAASVSPVAVPEPTPGAKLTLSGRFYDINGVQRVGDAPVSGYTLDDPLSVCLPLPAAFRANISDIVIVNRSTEGSLGILASTLRQSGGALTVCGRIGALPATVAVAKMGIVEPPPPDPMDPIVGPDTGATAPSNNTATMAFVLGAVVLAGAAGAAGINAIRRRRMRTRGRE